MDAAKTISALEVDGPSTTRVAEVIGLSVSYADLDPGAAAAIEFFVARLRATFILPALATGSRDELMALWKNHASSAMWLMDGIFLALHEASRVASGDLLARRLVHSDRAAIRSCTQTLEANFDPALADLLRVSNELIECARGIVRQAIEDSDDDNPLGEAVAELINQFHRSVLIWTIGFHLVFAITDRMSSLIQDMLPRHDLVADAIEFVSGGARLAGFYASGILGLELVDEYPSVKLDAALERTDFIAFLLGAAIEVRRVFGPDVRFGLAEFDYPDEPGAWELHLVIDSREQPDVADVALERLREEWWDGAAAGLGIDVYPVVAAFDHG